MSTTSYFHAVNAGDLIATMAGLRNLYNKTGDKAIVYQKIDHFASYYPNATHPTRDKNGTMVCMNESIFDKMLPLVKAQPYIEDLVKYEGQHYTVDLHRIHNGLFINMPKGIIQRWAWYAFPDLALGGKLEDAWIDVPYDAELNNIVPDRTLKNCIVINFTERYRNHQINYFFLKNYQDRLIFVGTPEEHKLFCDKWKLDIPFYAVYDFFELAQLIKQAAGFLGNQSMCWNIAEAMKVPRILELCEFAPNCFPVGGDFAVDYFYEGAVKFYVEELFATYTQSIPGYHVECPVCETPNIAAGTKKNVQYYRCKNCNTLFSKPLEQKDMVGGLHVDETEERALYNQERIVRFKEMGLTRDNAILDYGCGKGELMNELWKYGFNAFGYDPYDDELNVLPTGPFHIISMIEVVEHLTWPFNEFDKILPLLSDKGFLYIETSFSDWVNIDNDYCDPEKGHCTIFSHKSLKLLLEKKGFKYVGYINQNTLIFKKDEHNKENASGTGSQD